MTERILSELQKEYRNFFLEKMKLYGVKSPAELTKEKKSEFFTEIKNDWAIYKLIKNQKFQTESVDVKEIFEEPTETYDKKYSKEEKSEKTDTYKKQNDQEPVISQNTVDKHTSTKKRTQEQQKEQKVFTKQIIKSEPNNEQTDDLRILFTPNNLFEQTGQYLYPVVKMPKINSNLKLPRYGRSNQKGYKEDDFYNDIQKQISDLEISNNVHLVIPNYSKPYEPDILLFDKKINLYINIEIDEPYDGYYRYPTHNYSAETLFKQDNIRDLFFTESGWVVIRFTEKQVHKQSKECIDYIQNVINSIYSKDFKIIPKCEIEKQWNENQSIQWQLNYYREKYLEIPSFHKRANLKEVFVSIQDEVEPIEDKIQRTPFKDIQDEFDKDLHKYFIDNTGNAEYVSVTTLIERFFQFNILRYIERKAKEENRTEQDVLDELLFLRYEAAIVGTDLHLEIENYFNKKPFKQNLKEFKYFLNFVRDKIIPKGLTFIEAEKKIFYHKYNVAGTVDCLFKNQQGDWVMIDWKRSKKLIVKGTIQPDKRGFQIDIDGLNTLTNCSYYRYCIQQNMYKVILEKEYNIKISEMILVVLHENYSNYHTIKLPEMPTETNIIFKSINHKI
jgi:hypothetical protein